jgi:hypothetical protein
VVNFFTDTLPHLVEELSTQSYTFGPFQISLSQYDLDFIDKPIAQHFATDYRASWDSGQFLGTGALTVLAWALFVLVIAYFLLAQTVKVTDELIQPTSQGTTQMYSA